MKTLEDNKKKDVIFITWHSTFLYKPTRMKYIYFIKHVTKQIVYFAGFFCHNNLEQLKDTI